MSPQKGEEVIGQGSTQGHRGILLPRRKEKGCEIKAKADV